jgi:hypothetical protein
MVASKPESIGRGESRHITTAVRPFLFRSCERRLESIFVTNTCEATVLPQLIGVNGINNDAREPAWLARPLCQLLSEFSQRVTVSLRCFRSYFQRTFGSGIVRRQQNAAIGLNGEHAVPRFQLQPVGHIFGQRCTDGTARLSQRDFLGHALRVAHMCYFPLSG